MRFDEGGRFLKDRLRGTKLSNGNGECGGGVLG